MLEKKKVLIYLEEQKLSPRGGPYGVGYYLNKEIKRHDVHNITFLEGMDNANRKGLLSDIDKFFRIFIAPKKNKKVDINEFDIIHFHTARDLYLARKDLLHYTGTVVLTSHSPEPPAIETMNRISNRVPVFLKQYLKQQFEKADRYSFTRADYIVFPCEEAEEPYSNNWEFFNDYKKNNKDKFKYLLTGISECKPSRDKESIIQERGLTYNNFIISYVGRHNVVKGYEDLKKIGTLLLDNNEQFVFLVAGRQESIMPLNHERWIEIGYTTDAYSYIGASDIFILPNRETYFDLVMLEVLSLGKPVVASRTGGNKYFERINAEGIFLYDTVEEAVEIVKKLSQTPQKELFRLGEANKELFYRFFTSEKMYNNYILLLEELLCTK